MHGGVLVCVFDSLAPGTKDEYNDDGKRKEVKEPQQVSGGPPLCASGKSRSVWLMA